jgi:hypothetical protein
MKRPAQLLLTCLATFVAGATSMVASAADSAVAAQDLVKPRTSYLVMAAIWARQPDSYTLKVVLDRAKHAAKQRAIVDANKARLAANPQQPDPTALPPGDGIDRGGMFIADTIATLRGIDPWFHCGRIPTPIDGRNALQDRERKVEVWLLRSDGAQVLPEGYSCVVDPEAVEVVYTFSTADSQTAVAAAIRIEGDYFIEKLQSLEPAPMPRPQ